MRRLGNDAWSLYKRLFTFALKKMRCERDDALDAASAGICAALEHGCVEWHYAVVCTKNYVQTQRRNRYRRNEDYVQSHHEDGEDEESIEEKRNFIHAGQLLALEANECITAISALPGATRDVMRLVALGNEPDEIAKELTLPKPEVYWRTRVGRQLLRQRDGYELERKRGHHKYIGIRKECRRWNASFRHGDDSYWLGTFATAAEAAKAYDAKAKEILGAEAKLNFPVGIRD